MAIETGVGEIKLRVWYGLDPQSGRWGCPMLADRGWPIGSGPVESACSGKQGRFKRRGQFWIKSDVRHLESLIEARENKHWDELWFAT